MAEVKRVHVTGDPNMPQETRDALKRVAEAVWKQYVGEPVPEIVLDVTEPKALRVTERTCYHCRQKGPHVPAKEIDSYSCLSCGKSYSTRWA